MWIILTLAFPPPHYNPLDSPSPQPLQAEKRKVGLAAGRLRRDRDAYQAPDQIGREGLLHQKRVQVAAIVPCFISPVSPMRRVLQISPLTFCFHPTLPSSKTMASACYHGGKDQTH
ncbi:hypothetical protein CB1_001066001 [Camelus ferus]|nr:hypothetical protein CB1_001066001 [Camelus ferus]